MTARRAALLFGAAFCALAMVLGSLWGRLAATPLRETEAINRWAAVYVAEAGAGASVSDCAARPSASAGVWMILRCVAPGAETSPRVYVIGPDGALMETASTEWPST